MVALLTRALLCWLCVFELVARWRGWRGLAWSRGSVGTIWLLLFGSAAGIRSRGFVIAGCLLITLPLAVVLQLFGASLRNRAIDPRRRLQPGEHDEYRVEALQLTMPEGFVPGLLLIPHTSTDAAVCVLHGAGDHKAAYTWWLADTLLAQGLAVLLIDLDGHGENPRTQRYPDTIDDVTVAVEWLRRHYARVGVLGISLGGCISARAAADGTPIDALVVLEAPPLLHFTKADMSREALALAQWPLLDLFCDCTVEHLVQAWSTTPTRTAISTWDLIAKLDLLGSLPKIATPLLLVYGGRDAIVKPAQAEQVRQAAPAHAAFHMIPSASHLTMILDRGALQLVANWLREQLITST